MIAFFYFVLFPLSLLFVVLGLGLLLGLALLFGAGLRKLWQALPINKAGVAIVLFFVAVLVSIYSHRNDPPPYPPTTYEEWAKKNDELWQAEHPPAPTPTAEPSKLLRHDWSMSLDEPTPEE